MTHKGLIYRTKNKHQAKQKTNPMYNSGTVLQTTQYKQYFSATCTKINILFPERVNVHEQESLSVWASLLLNKVGTIAMATGREGL